MAKILVIEDEQAVSRLIEDYLAVDHHEVEVAADGKDASTRLTAYNYDLIVLDWELPGMTGIELLKHFRERGGTTRVLMLTGKQTVDEKEKAFDYGADDYLTKPFSGRELSARIRALLRRPEAILGDVLQVGPFALDRRNYQASKNGEPLTLVPREFDLLEFFMRNPGRVYSAAALLNLVWSNESEATEDAVTTCVKRLRKKIDDNEKQGFIRTIYGVGYRFEVG